MVIKVFISSYLILDIAILSAIAVRYDTEGCEATHDLVQNPGLIWLQSITQFQIYANCTYSTDVYVTFLYGFIMFILSTIFRDTYISRYMSINIYDIYRK